MLTHSSIQVKPATLAEAMVTCPVTVPKARNATIVRPSRSWKPLSTLTDRDRWRARTSEPRLPLGAFFGARLLQVQAARTRSGSLPELSSRRPLYSPRRWIITFFLSYSSDCIPRLAVIEGDCRVESTVLVFQFPAFTH